MRSLFILLFALLAFAQAATPVNLFDQGQYQQAYRAASSLHTAAGFALAAESATFYAMYQAKDNSTKVAWFDKSVAAARKAIKLAPKGSAGYMELARAQGRLAQYRGILESLSLANSVKSNLNKVLELSPNNATAMVALALWNLELSQKGVGWLFGASISRIVPLFENAIALEPRVIIHRLEFAKALVSLHQQARAEKQLKIALSLPVVTAADSYDQAGARHLLDQLRNTKH